MDTERIAPTRADEPSPPTLRWQAAFALGLITLVLGVIVITRPTGSLMVIAVLLGATMIVSGVFHIVRALDGREHERVWRGISGVLFILAGMVLIRHLDLSLTLIGLFIGFTWIIQGVAALVESFSRGRGLGENGWSLLFAVLSLVAGIIVVAAPMASVAALTLFMGAWFIVMGLMEMGTALLGRRAQRKAAARRVDAGRASVPGQRGGEAEAGQARVRERAGHSAPGAAPGAAPGEGPAAKGSDGGRS